MRGVLSRECFRMKNPMHWKMVLYLQSINLSHSMEFCESQFLGRLIRSLGSPEEEEEEVERGGGGERRRRRKEEEERGVWGSQRGKGQTFFFPQHSLFLVT